MQDERKTPRHEKRKNKNISMRRHQHKVDKVDEHVFQYIRDEDIYYTNLIESLRQIHEKNMIGLNYKDRYAERFRYIKELEQHYNIPVIADEISHIEHQSWGDELDMYDRLC